MKNKKLIKELFEVLENDNTIGDALFNTLEKKEEFVKPLNEECDFPEIEVVEFDGACVDCGRKECNCGKKEEEEDSKIYKNMVKLAERYFKIMKSKIRNMEESEQLGERVLEEIKELGFEVEFIKHIAKHATTMKDFKYWL